MKGNSTNPGLPVGPRRLGARRTAITHQQIPTLCLRTRHRFGQADMPVDLLSGRNASS